MKRRDIPNGLSRLIFSIYYSYSSFLNNAKPNSEFRIPNSEFTII